MLYLGSCAGKFQALDAYTGQVLWEYDTTEDGGPRNFHGDALITSMLVIIGSDGVDGGNVYAFNRANGDVRWKFDAGRGITSDIVRAGQRVLAVTLEDELVCLDIVTGKLRWRFASGWARTGADREASLLCSTPAIANDVALFGGRNGQLFALDVSNGKLRWKRKLGGRITTSVAFDGDALVVGVSDNRLIRLSAETGSVQQELRVEGKPFGPLLSTEDRLVLFLDWAQPTSKVIAVDRRLRGPLWQTSAPENRRWITARPFRLDDKILVGTDEGEIHALNLRDGSREHLGSIEGDVRIFGAANGVLYIGTIQGVLRAFVAP